MSKPNEAVNRLEKYCGDRNSIRPESWLKLYELETAKLTEEERINNLIYYLSKDALEWFADEIVSNTSIKKWDTVKSKLVQRFGTFTANPIVLASHRRLRKEETVQDYYKDKIRVLNQTSLKKEEKVQMLTDGLPLDWKDVFVASQPQDPSQWVQIAMSVEQNRKQVRHQNKFKPKVCATIKEQHNTLHKSSLSNNCPYFCPICIKKGVKVKHWVNDCKDYDPNYKANKFSAVTTVNESSTQDEEEVHTTVCFSKQSCFYKLIQLNVLINDNPVQSFMDTGATISIMSWKLCKFLKLPINDNSQIQIQQVQSTAYTCGSVEVNLKIQRQTMKVKFHILKDFHYPLLIGLDIAEKFQLIVDIKDKTVYCKQPNANSYSVINHLQVQEHKEVDNLLYDYQALFSQHETDIGRIEVQHRILTQEHFPISCRPYRRPLSEYNEIARQLKQLLEKKLIKESHSPWAFPVVLVPKKDGTKRLCIDYRKLNEITIDDKQPLPIIQDMFDRLHGAKYFTTLDIAWGYWHVEMHPDSIEKTAFVTNDGHYEFLVMPFGLKNAASTFQRIIQHILGDLLWKGACNFQDDILIYSNNFEEHIDLLRKVFQKLKENNIKLKFKKCCFVKEEIKYLGHVISHNMIKPDPDKTKSIDEFPHPTTIKQVRQFLGLSNYYRKFIPKFSEISHPLTNLIRKGKLFQWNEKAEEAFNKLKIALTSSPVLTTFDPNLSCKLYTDASKLGIGAILTQEHADKSEHVIAYFSKKLLSHQTNYSAFEMECYAVVQAIDHFEVYLDNKPFEVITDHSALVWLFNMKKPKAKFFRWIINLTAKSFKIVHRSGSRQTHVDALSRAPVLAHVSVQDLQNHQQQSDLSFVKNPQSHQNLVMVKHRGTLKAVVPDSFQNEILREYHDKLSHPSINKTIKLIIPFYWWPNAIQSIKTYVRSCKICQIAKHSHQPSSGEYIVPESDLKPMELIGLDTIVLGSAANDTRHKYIQVFVDHLTRFVWAFPTVKNTAQAVIQCFDKIIKTSPQIQRLLTDNGKNFTSKEFNKFLSQHHIKHTYSSPYHPQCNGLCEKVNDTIATKIRIALQENPRLKWSTVLPKIVKDYNSTPHDVTTFSPNFLLFGDSFYPSFASQPCSVEEARKLAIDSTRKHKETWRKRHDAKHPPSSFNVGDLVLRKFASNEPTLIKTSPRYEGPFKITKMLSNVTCEISNKDVTPFRVHVSQLKSFIPRE